MYDSIYISPHLDDAAFSCGGQIADATLSGKRVLIVTITAGDPPPEDLSSYAQSLHARWELDRTAVAGRRNEDAQACNLIGAEFQHWAIPDCIYRRTADRQQSLYNSDSDIFGAVQHSDLTLVNQLAQMLSQLPPTKRIVAPLGVGQHVDHQLTRLAVDKAFKQHESLYFYEDYPYAHEAAAVAPFVTPDHLWESQTIPISEIGFEKKVAAFTAFASQLSTFFDGDDHLRQQLISYSKRVGGERLWHKLTIFSH